MVLKFQRAVGAHVKDFLMLPDNFDFALLPTGSNHFSLAEVGMLASTIENIDYAITSWLKVEVDPTIHTNEGFKTVPVLWQAPERAYQIKNNKDLRDDAGALKLPIISVERTSVVKDPNRKGSWQANLYSNRKNGRSGRMVIAKKIKQDKTRNFAVAAADRQRVTSGTEQRYSPRINKKVVIQTLSIPIPVYVNIEYKITIKSEYQQHMNQIMTPFITRTGQINSFLMRRNGHLYEAFIDQNFNNGSNISNLSEELRMFSTEFTIRVLGYLIGEEATDDRPLVRFEESAVEVTFPQEEVAPPGLPNLFGDILK
jgi:hypothetical protein